MVSHTLHQHVLHMDLLAYCPTAHHAVAQNYIKFAESVRKAKLYLLNNVQLKWLKVSHLECDLHQKITISRVLCKECLLQNITKISAN